MILDSTKLNSLWEWARFQAPFDLPATFATRKSPDMPAIHRRVRIEISAESAWLHGGNVQAFVDRKDAIICRVYLAEPRYEVIGVGTDTVVRFIPSELAPLAETRIF